MCTKSLVLSFNPFILMKKKNLFFLILHLSVLLGCESVDQENKEATWAMQSFFNRQDINPILTSDSSKFNCPITETQVKWNQHGVSHPIVAVRNKAVYMLVEGKDEQGTSRLGIAISADGLRFSAPIGPLLYPDNDFMKDMEWEKGLTNPRIAENENGTYMLFYVANNGTHSTLCSASSTDFLNWVKNGPVFEEQPAGLEITSGSLLTKQVGDKFVAQKINGHYWMYFSATSMYAATSDDLIHWAPLTEDGALKPVFQPRSDSFDNKEVICGPFALLTADGIVFLYNGINADNTSQAGEVLLDAADPTRVIHRLKDGLPSLAQTAISGLAFHNSNWKLYFSINAGVGLAMK